MNVQKYFPKVFKYVFYFKDKTMLLTEQLFSIYKIYK